MLNTAILEHEAVQVFAECEFNGMGIDVEAWKRNSALNGSRLDTKLQELDRVFVDNFPKGYYDTSTSKGLKQTTNNQLAMFGPKRLSNVQWTSHSEKLAIFKGLGLPINSTAEDILMPFKSNPVVKTYLEYNDLQTQLTKFGLKFLNNINPKTGRVHTSYWQIKNSGRCSSSKPNLQQIPSDKAFRKCFKADRGNKLIIFDYSQQELVLIADDSKEPAFLEAFELDRDVHSIVASMMYQEEWEDMRLDNCRFESDFDKCSCPGHKPLRDYSKTISYGLSYGATKYKLSESLNITVDRAEMMLNEYFDTFKGLDSYFKKLKASIKRKYYVRTMAPFRRHRFFTADSEVESMLREGANTRIQGSGADMMKFAMVLMWRKRNRYREFRDVKMIHPTHDEMMCEAPEPIAERWAEVQQECMLEASYANCSIGVKVDGTVCDNWAEAK